MPVSVSLTLTDEQAAAVQWEAARYQVTLRGRLETLLAPALDDAVRRHREARWERRRRALEADPTLAATVDRAGSEA